jgi:hypothetical protein
MKLFFLALGFATAASVLVADPVITTSVSCTSYGAQTIAAVSSCEEGGPLNTQGASPSYAFAKTEAFVTLQTVASDWLTVSMKNTVNPVDGAAWMQEHGTLPPNQLHAPASASASISVHIDSYTLGAVRPGILQVQWSPIPAGSYGDFFPAAGFSIEDPLVYNDSFTQNCSGINGTNCYGPGPARPPIPFELGTSFTFDSFATVWADSMDGVGGGYNGMLVQFRFFEADGVTPVLSYDPPLYAAPEPRNLAAVGLFGLLLIMCGRAKFKSYAKERAVE